MLALFLLELDYKYVVIFIFIYEWQSVRVCQNPNNAG